MSQVRQISIDPNGSGTLAALTEDGQVAITNIRYPGASWTILPEVPDRVIPGLPPINSKVRFIAKADGARIGDTGVVIDHDLKDARRPLFVGIEGLDSFWVPLKSVEIIEPAA